MGALIPNHLVDGGESLTVRVRGLRAAGDTPVHLCLHCGVPLATAATRESGFCCAGCSYVYRLVHEHGLEGYYKIKDAVLPPVDPVVFQPRDYAWLEELQQTAEKGEPGLAPAAAPELTLEVQGISCAGCVWLIEKIFHQQPGALQIETDAPLGRMRLRWARGEFDAPAFGRTLQGFNYLLGPPGEAPAVSESKLLVRRVGLCAAFSMNIMLFSLPVYFGMQATFPYAPLFGTLSMGFATLSLLTGGTYFLSRAVRALRDGVMHIDLPIAVGILGAYLGSLYGWLSGREAFVYFDFVGAFILLMLTGRWAQVAAVERNRRRLLTAQARPHKVGVIAADGSVADQPVEALRIGDSFLVRAGQVVPVEAQLESPAATLGTAWITGEADPRECRTGARVPAGALNLSRTEIRLRAAQAWSASLLAQLLRPAERNVHRHRLLERIVKGYLIGVFFLAGVAGFGWWLGTHDVARTWSVVTAILVVSCPCAIGLAFPLADEMATVSLRRFGVFVREADVWPRLARIRKIIFDKTGTLTLETPVLENPEALATLSPLARAALAVLVRDNAHPASQCLHENLLAGGFQNGAFRAQVTVSRRPDELSGTTSPAPQIDGSVCIDRTARPSGESAGQTASRSGGVPAAVYERTAAETPPFHEISGFEPVGLIDEEPGFGVTVRSANGLWSLGRPGWRGGRTSNPIGYEYPPTSPGGNSPDIPKRSEDPPGQFSGEDTSNPIGYLLPEDHDTEFACDGVVLARFRLRDAIRADAAEEIAALHTAGFQSYILSGDRREKVAQMAQQLGIPSAQAMAETTPQAKADWLGRLDRRDTLMLGDGANDSLAFDAAFVRGTPVIHRGVLEGKADFYYLGHGLAGIRRLFEVNETRRRTQAWLLVFSIAYNALAVGLAAAGHMNPLLAAILMPVSSLLSLALVVGGMRQWLRR